MAKQSYSYDDFIRLARAEGMLDRFSEADLQLARVKPEAGISLLSYKRDYAAASTDEARALAHAGAQRVRSMYGGYTAGEDGLGQTMDGVGDDDYVNQFTDRQTAALRRLETPFFYDSQEDPLWQSYEKQYRREGELAYRNSLGEAAANTGGIASTAAVAAAQQAQNYYGAQAADKKAQLYQQAYENWLAARQSDMDAIGLYDQLEQSRQEAAQQRHDNAVEKWKNYGYVTEDIARELELPVGTAYTEQAYDRWYQAFQEAKSGISTGLTHYDTVNLGEKPEPVIRDSADRHKTLRIGANSLDVQTMQRYLEQLGYPCGSQGADGKFGAGTLAALRAFQRSTGIYADGVCGPVTWTALINAAGA